MGIPNKLLIGRDANKFIISQPYERPFSDMVASFLLVANTATTIGVPQGADIACFKFSSGTDVWVTYNVPATIPTNADLLLLESGFELLLENSSAILLEGVGEPESYNATLNPDVRTVTNVKQISFISTGTPGVSVEFYNRLNFGLF